MRRRAGAAQVAVQCTQEGGGLQSGCQCDSGHDHEGQQGPGVSGGSAARRGAYACARRGRKGSGAGVLCGGYAGDAEAGDGGGGWKRVWRSIV